MTPPIKLMTQVSLLALMMISLSFTGAADAADKLRVSNCYIGGAILPLWMAKDAGY